MTDLATPQIIVFTDLDDSLFQTRRKCSGEGISPAAYSQRGEPISFHTPQQRGLLTLLSSACLIPVTGRSSAALTRVTSVTWSSYRVVSHGAMILDLSGAPLKSWLDLIEDEIVSWSPRLRRAHEYVERWVARWSAAQELPITDPIRIKMTRENDLEVYLSIKGPREALLELKSSLSELWSGGTIHHNDRNMALLPSYASKARAVAHLREIITGDTPPPLFIGIGDSISDLPFLRQCHFALTPQHSQIHQELWQ